MQYTKSLVPFMFAALAGGFALGSGLVLGIVGTSKVLDHEVVLVSVEEKK